jgi:hypothetical protein
MDRYQRVEKPREEEPIGANEIRITAQGRTRNYITYALALLQVTRPFSLAPLRSAPSVPAKLGGKSNFVVFAYGDLWVGRV